MVLEIKGTNTTKLINSKTNQVSIRDVRKNLHYLELYGLEEITKNYNPINPRICRMICNKFGIKPSEVKQPADNIHCMIFTRSNYLMSDKVVKKGQWP